MASPATSPTRAPRRVVAAALAVLVGLTIASGSAQAATGGADPGWRAEMLRTVNALRAQAGVDPLEPCPSLRRAAQGYARVMAATGTFDHIGPDGTAPWDRMRAQGFQWQAAAENIARGQTSVQSVMQAWVASPGHAANLVDPRMTKVGFGFAPSPRGGYWVQNFGTGTGC